MAESDGDKTEAPTPRRRTEAREQGNIARSHDLTSSVLLIGGSAADEMVRTRPRFSPFATSSANCFPPRRCPISPPTASAAGRPLPVQVSVALSPLLGGAMFIVIVVNLAQVGFNFSPQRLAINFAALNPVRGFTKSSASGQGGAATALNLLKVALVTPRRLVGHRRPARSRSSPSSSSPSSRSSASARTWSSPSACASACCC